VPTNGATAHRVPAADLVADARPRPGDGLDRPALLIVDLQRGDAHPDCDYVRRRRARDGDEAAEYYLGRIREQVLPNVGRLQAAMRDRGWPVIFVRIQSLTPDGRDRSPDHVRRGIHFPPGSPDGEILPEVAPLDGEIVLSKTSNDGFHGTGLGDILANMGRRDLVVTGVVTGSCVQATALAAAQRGAGRVVVVSDATATWSPAMQALAEAEMAAPGAELLPTAAVVAAIEAAAQAG
jgi:nicotinamidase-related amidase